MKRDYQIWNILHDEALVDLKGNAARDIRIKVKIEYLANKFSGQYDHIIVNLKNCTMFEYERQWLKDDVQVYKTIKELEGMSPALMVLSCDEENDHLIIWDICGIIKTKYDSAELTLENGEPLSFEELDNASKEFWDNFGKKSGT